MNTFKRQSRVVTMLVTPEVAQKWLDTINTKNRKISKRHVSFLAKQMVDGKWVDTSKTIGIDYNGVLADGQHRLKAIVQSGVPQRLHVAFDVEPFNGLVADEKLRSSLDNFTAQGIKCNMYTSSALKALGKFLLHTGDRINNYTIVDLFYVFGADLDAARKICRSHCKGSGVSYSAHFTVTYFLMHPFHLEKDLNEVFARVLGGENLKSYSQTYKYHHNNLVKGGDQQNKMSIENFFMDMEDMLEFGEKKRRTKKHSETEKVEMMCNAIDHFNKIWRESDE